MKAEAKSTCYLGECNQLTVPFFQRRYVWDEENWGEFLNSFSDQNTVPFLGSLILREEGKNNYTIIDGQQRLTTVTILAKAIFDCMPASSKAPDSGVRRTIESYLFYRKNAADDFKDSIVKLQHSHVDHDDYERVITSQLRGAPPIDLGTINEKSGSVLRCYKYYCEMLQHKSEKELKELFSAVFRGESKVFVVIELEHGDVNEQIIFDTINRAGVHLSTADIIKNNLFKNLLDKSVDEETREHVIQLYSECWDSVFSSNRELTALWDDQRVFGNVKHTNLEFLLYCVACIKWGEDRDMFADLASIYEHRVEKMNFSELCVLVNEIKQYAELFKKYILDFKADLENEEKNVYIKFDDHITRLLLILQKFKVQMFYPYVLKRLQEAGKSKNNAGLLSDFRKLESFIMRRKISPRGTHDYTSKCYEIIQKGVDALIDSDFSSADGKISDYEIKNYLLNTKDDVARMILFCIELKRRQSNKICVKALQYNQTVEHIMPKKWEKFWKDVKIMDGETELSPESPEGREFRNRTIQAIGNKTLLTDSLNSSVKNGPFLEKLNGKGIDKPGYRELATLFVTKEIVTAAEKDPVWDEKHIIDRSNRLYHEFIEIWPSYKCQEEGSNSTAMTGQYNEDPVLSQYTEEELADPIKLVSAVPVGIHPECKLEGSTPEEQPNSGENAMSVKEQFLQMVDKMAMSHSYKPVLLKAIFEQVDKDGTVDLEKVVSYFLMYYKYRRNNNIIVEKPDSIFTHPECTYADARALILRYPLDRFERRNFFKRNAKTSKIEINRMIWDELKPDDIAWILKRSEAALCDYFDSL